MGKKDKGKKENKSPEKKPALCNTCHKPLIDHTIAQIQACAEQGS